MLNITDDQYESLHSCLCAGVTDEDHNDVEAFLTDLGVSEDDAQEVGNLVVRVGAKASEVGGCFCFGCPFDLTDLIKELEAKLSGLLTVDGEDFDL